MLAAYALAAFLTIPFALVATIEYFRMRQRYLRGAKIERIIDIKRAFHRITFGLAALTFIAVGAYISLTMMPKDASQTMVLLTFAIFCLLALVVAALSGKAFAAGLIGVVLNRSNGTLSFPTDGILRSFSDVSTISNAVIPNSMVTIKVSEIKGFNRQAGRTLIIHGAFGSRAITFSDKLRRDQLLASLSDFRRFIDLEFAGPGDYA
jgi:hypothetical protein